MMQSPSVLALRQSHAKAEPVKARPVKAGPVKAGPVKTNAKVNAKIERKVFMAFTPLALLKVRSLYRLYGSRFQDWI
jgi:hypothetical protein